MKLIVRTPRPRNPLVAPSRRRKAGAHRSRSDTDRRQAERALQRELARLEQGP